MGIEGGFFEFYRDLAAGGEPETLDDEIEVIVVDPNGCKIVGHAQDEGVFRGLQAHDGFKPKLIDVLREEPLEIAFDGFPEVRRYDG